MKFFSKMKQNFWRGLYIFGLWLETKLHQFNIRIHRNIDYMAIAAASPYTGSERHPYRTRR